MEVLVQLKTGGLTWVQCRIVVLSTTIALEILQEINLEYIKEGIIARIFTSQ